MGLLLPCGGAASSCPPRQRSWLTVIGSSQPKLDIHARGSGSTAAVAKDFPKAAVQQAVAALANAASRTSDREAQKVSFAKFGETAPTRRAVGRCAPLYRPSEILLMP